MDRKEFPDPSQKMKKKCSKAESSMGGTTGWDSRSRLVKYLIFMIGESVQTYYYSLTFAYVGLLTASIYTCPTYS